MQNEAYTVRSAALASISYDVKIVNAQ